MLRSSRRWLAFLIGAVALVLACPGGALAATAPGDSGSVEAETQQAKSYRWVNEGGPYGGNVFTVTLCVGTPDVLYAATSNGVFKSTDGAATWQPTGPLRRDGSQTLVSDVAVSATDADIVYAADGSLHKSTDGGASWTTLRPDGRRSGGANGVEVDPKEPDTVYVWDQSRGVCKSTDGGESWEIKSTGLSNFAFWSFEVDAHFPATLFAVTWCKQATYVSSDGGATWSKSDGTIEDLTIKKLERDPDNPKAFTLVLVDNDRELIFESPNGMNWNTRSKNAWHLMPMQLSIDKDDPKSMSLPILNHDARDVFVTTDGAETWHLVELPFDPRELKAMRADSTRAGILYAARQKDVYYFSDDGGESWEFFYSAESDPDAEQTATIDELRTCFLYGIGPVDERFRWTVSRMIPHPSDPNIVYRADYSSVGVLKTVDFGKHWVAANEGLSAYPTRSIACDGDTPGVVYACSAYAVHKSTDGGKSWKEAKPSQLMNGALLAVHPLDPQIVLVAENYQRSSADISADGGETWRQIEEISASRVEAIVFDSKNADTFYILADTGIFETTDRGRTWHSTGRPFKTSYHMLSGNFPGTCQASADVIYQIHDQRKLLRSTDVGQTWKELTLPKTASYIRSVHVYSVDPRRVIVADQRNKLSISDDAGDTWRAIPAARRLRRNGWWVHCIGMDPADPDVFYVSCPYGGGGILRTQDGGKTFDELATGLPGPHVVQIVVSPADGAVYAATDGAGVYRLVIEEETKPDENEE